MPVSAAAVEQPVVEVQRQVAAAPTEQQQPTQQQHKPGPGSIVKGVVTATGKGCRDVLAPDAATLPPRGACWTTRGHRVLQLESSCLLQLRARECREVVVRISFGDPGSVPARVRFDHAVRPTAPFEPLGEVALQPKSLSQLRHLFRLCRGGAVQRCLRITLLGHLASEDNSGGECRQEWVQCSLTETLHLCLPTSTSRVLPTASLAAHRVSHLLITGQLPESAPSASDLISLQVPAAGSEANEALLAATADSGVNVLLVQQKHQGNAGAASCSGTSTQPTECTRMQVVPLHLSEAQGPCSVPTVAAEPAAVAAPPPDVTPPQPLVVAVKPARLVPPTPYFSAESEEESVAGEASVGPPPIPAAHPLPPVLEDPEELEGPTQAQLVAGKQDEAAVLVLEAVEDGWLANEGPAGGVEQLASLKDVDTVTEAQEAAASALFASQLEQRAALLEVAAALLRDACREVEACELLQAVLEAAPRCGGAFLNAGNRGGTAKGFQVDALLGLKAVVSKRAG